MTRRDLFRRVVGLAVAAKAAPIVAESAWERLDTLDVTRLDVFDTYDTRAYNDYGYMIVNGQRIDVRRVPDRSWR
jgi:hypothetical protein